MSARKSSIGRPRALTDEQVKLILAWHESVRAWAAQRKELKTLRQLAKELSVAPSTAYDVIRLRGEYKLAAPEPVRSEGTTDEAAQK